MYNIVIRVRLYHVITNAGDTNYGTLYLRYTTIYAPSFWDQPPCVWVCGAQNSVYILDAPTPYSIHICPSLSYIVHTGLKCPWCVFCGRENGYYRGIPLPAHPTQTRETIRDRVYYGLGCRVLPATFHISHFEWPAYIFPISRRTNTTKFSNIHWAIQLV